VRPHLEYSISAWSVVTNYSKDKALIERIQHRFARTFPQLKKLTYEEKIDCLGIPTMEERRNHADLLHLFKMYKGLSSTPFSHFFSISSVMNTWGHTAKLIKSRCQLDTRRFSERVIDRWNCLDQEAIDSSTVNSFKNILQRIRKTSMGFFMDLLVHLA